MRGFLAISNVLLSIILLRGVIAKTDSLVLEQVEARRVRHGWGLQTIGNPSAVRIAVEDCDMLGTTGGMKIDDQFYPVYVVDCCAEPGCLSKHGLIADVSGHSGQEALIWLISHTQ